MSLSEGDFAHKRNPSAPGREHEDEDLEVVDVNMNGMPDHQEMQSCCSGTGDRRFGIFLVQVCMTMGMLVLCLHQIGNARLDCESTQLHVSLLSLITGVWLKELRL